MIKLLILLDKKAGMTDEAFRSRYENGHAILAKRVFPSMTAYKRNYVRLEGGKPFTGGKPPPFDVITEMHFRDRAAFNAAMKVLEDPDTAKLLADDEASLFDRSNMRAFLVEECSSDVSS
jgi:hypothetical protein